MLQSSWPTQPQVLKARDVSLLLKCLSRNGFTQPNLKIHLESSNSHKEKGWGGLSKCSQGSQDVLKCSCISTPEWVKSWGINTPSHKTSRCPVSVRPVRPVPRTSQTGTSLFSAVSTLSLWLFSLGTIWALLVLSKPTDVASLLIVRHTYTQVYKWNIQFPQSQLELHILIMPSILQYFEGINIFILWAYPLWASDFESLICIWVKSNLIHKSLSLLE